MAAAHKMRRAYLSQISAGTSSYALPVPWGPWWGGPVGSKTGGSRTPKYIIGQLLCPPHTPSGAGYFRDSCPRWAPAVSFAWFCIFIVLLYLFLQLWRRHGGTAFCWYAATQVACQLQQEHTQVVCSNTKAQKRLTESNSTPAMDLGHKIVVFKWCMCRFRNCAYYYYDDDWLLLLWFFPPFCFFWSSLNVYAGWDGCGGGVACYVECMYVVKKW